MEEASSEDELAGEGSGPLTGGIPGPGATGGALSVATLRSRWEAPPSPIKVPMQSVPQVQLGSRPFEERGGASGSRTGGLAVSPRKDPLAGLPPPGLSLGTTPPAWTASGIPGPVPSGVVVPTPVNPKLDPPPRFNGGKQPGVCAWLQSVERWLRLQHFRVEEWVDIVATRLEGAALSWINSELSRIQLRQRAPFASWQIFMGSSQQRSSPLLTRSWRASR